MAELTFAQMWGANHNFTASSDFDDYSLYIDLKDFRNTVDGGQITDDLGISDFQPFIDSPEGKNIKILYAILLLIMQNQAANINDDPDQSIWIQENSASLGVGSRSGQIRRSFTINFFTPGNVGNKADIDDI